MTAEEWIERFARQLGSTPPDAEQLAKLLDLAALAAHSSERRAAPVACWLAGISGRPPAELIEAAEAVGEDGDG